VGQHAPVRAYGWVSFTSDFGRADGFVAACHGVIARLAPAVRVLDVTHDVPRGDVRAGATLLAQTLPSLPAAVHLAVVDPGVGTARRAVVLAAGGSLLVGPDNGLLGWAADALGGLESAHLVLGPEPASATFHGRDVFAPAAARLALGAPLGPAATPDSLVRLAPPVGEVIAGQVRTEVLAVDRYGNAQLAVGPDALATAGLHGESVTVRTPAGERLVPLARTFGDLPSGELLLFTDSAGLLALAVNGGDAARLLGLSPGDEVAVGPGS
jgi:S-adenosylmethionine hydrolase